MISVGSLLFLGFQCPSLASWFLDVSSHEEYCPPPASGLPCCTGDELSCHAMLEEARSNNSTAVQVWILSLGIQSYLLKKVRLDP